MKIFPCRGKRENHNSGCRTEGSFFIGKYTPGTGFTGATEYGKQPVMIYNQWYVILESRELKENKPLRVKPLNEPLALWRVSKGQACCVADRCCHRGASLSCVKVINGQLECPFHGFLYDKSGKVTLIPANGKVKITNLWSGEYPGIFRDVFAQNLSAHASGLYKIETPGRYLGKPRSPFGVLFSKVISPTFIR